MSNSLTIVQSASSQSALPVFRELVSSSKDRTLLFSFLYPPELFAAERDNLTVIDWTDRIPGYSDEPLDLLGNIPTGEKVPSVAFSANLATTLDDKPVTVVIDSIETLLSDLESVSAVVTLLKKVRQRQNTNLILHVVQSHESKDLVAHLSQTSFSPSLVLHTAYPTSLLVHISTNYMTPPPPLSPEPKFWSVFLPISERQHDIDAIVYGGEGSGSHVTEEFVVETITRGGQNGSRKRRAFERNLRGWKSPNGFCELKDLAQLKGLWGSGKIPHETVCASRISPQHFSNSVFPEHCCRPHHKSSVQPKPDALSASGPGPGAPSIYAPRSLSYDFVGGSKLTARF
jgi:elongator complex protein 5